MVRKFVAGMTRMPVVLILCLALVAVGIVLLLQPQPARAGVVYTSPFWTVTAGVQEKACQTCGCEMPSAIVEPGVSVLTGELVLSIPITSSPTMLGSMPIGLVARSMISGGTEFGLGMIPSWMTTVEDTGGGTGATVRLPSGVVVFFTASGGTYSTSDCCFHDTLTKNGAGRFVLTALDGSTRLFDANGMPDVFTDANSNTTDFTCGVPEKSFRFGRRSRG